MNAATAVEAIDSIVSLAKQVPELISAIEGIFEAIKAGNDPTPAIKAAQVAAAEKFLGI